MEMETIGAYMPLAGTGCNTMRLCPPGHPYNDVLVGDSVHMYYREEAGRDNTRIAFEKLQVAGIARGPLEVLSASHAPLNHGVIHARRAGEIGANPTAAHEWMMTRMSELYGKQAGEHPHPFVVMYFR